MTAVAKAIDLWEKLVAYADRLAPDIRRKYLDTINAIKDQVATKEVIRALENRDIALAADLILGPPNASAEVWSAITHSVREALFRVGSDTLANAKVTVQGQIGPAMALHFDIANARAIAAVQWATTQLIRDISEGTRQAIKFYVTEQLNNGTNPRTLITQLVGRVQDNGTRLGGIIGLTDRQASAVLNFRQMLETRNSDLFTRVLRDHRFDAEIRRAFKSQTSLSPGRIDFLVGRYESRYLAYRAETIARTESLKALAAGRKLAWDQAIERGAISREALIKRWVTAKDERVRPRLTSKGVPRYGYGIEHNHRQMRDMVVGYDEMFVAPDSGERVWGPPAGVNCRCIAWIRPKRGAE